MEEFLKSYGPYAAPINTGIILVLAGLFVMRLNDAVMKFQKTLDGLSTKVQEMEIRLAKVETILMLKGS